MLRKGEENIFADVWSQVYAIIIYLRRILTFHRHVQRVSGQTDDMHEGFEATSAIAVDRKFNFPLNQNRVSHPIGVQMITHRLLDPNQLIVRIKLEFLRRKFAIQPLRLFLNTGQI